MHTLKTTANALSHTSTTRTTKYYHSGIDLKTPHERLEYGNTIYTIRYVQLADAYFSEINREILFQSYSTVQESETLVQQSFELVGKDESRCLWKKPKTSEDVVRRHK